MNPESIYGTHKNEQIPEPAAVEELMAELYHIKQRAEENLPGEKEAYEARMDMLLAAIRHTSPDSPKFGQYQQDYVKSNDDLHSRMHRNLSDASELLKVLPPDLAKRFAHITLSPEELQHAFNTFLEKQTP